MKQKDLMKMVCAAEEVSRKAIEELSSNDNPQVVELLKKHEAYAEAFEAVRQAMNGNPTILKIMGTM